MGEAKSLDDMRLYLCSLLVHGIRAECSADYGACGAAALGQHDQLCNRRGNIVRIWGIDRLEHFCEVLEHSAGNLANCSVGSCSIGVSRLLSAGIHWGWIRARL